MTIGDYITDHRPFLDITDLVAGIYTKAIYTIINKSSTRKHGRPRITVRPN